ncbi:MULTISPECIES: hypothetical protein [Pseudoalteromonas]|jgi:hypothetical protein|uniref:hypothetical protein n=1 Tax=Pseudoalteromonas TaxID=53246 RepID=UPI000ED0EBD2|nr:MULTISPECIES: hypothetical protein [unclassified Pseudoalteromonas]MCF2921430.1 hypothetical protein [Pseudoalteromonas sp. APAL1]TMO46554.1 hypothetical protein CWC25_03350 [Pseudoalteromonas sp. S4389]HCV01927.1 hypothetical protein [Pseudoalteromonas sp.]|tara:strand:- start:1644 stop:2021 length:378 start_codon:yes stop_codon:yes gene_type:complete
MGNLFLREKENWFAWSIWGIIGAALTFFVAISTRAPQFLGLSAIGFLLLLTWWMHSTKRFDFGRAFKVCCYVLTLTCLPAFLLVIVPNNNLNKIDVIVQGAGFALISLIVCFVCSMIARRPKQYY